MEILIGGGLATLGYFLNKSDNIVEKKSEFDVNLALKTGIDTYNYNKPYDNERQNIYKVDILDKANSIIYNKISNDCIDSQKPNSNIVNNIWRIENDTINNIKKNEINNLIINDINMIKKPINNNIETMRNLPEKSFEYDNSDDSNFSDNYSLPDNHIKQKSKRQRLKHKNINDNITEMSDKYSDEGSNINIRVLNQQDKFLSDVVTNLSGNDNSSDDSNYNVYPNVPTYPNRENPSELDQQFGQLEFDHKGLPETMQNGKQVLNIFNDKIKFAPQSNFNPQCDGRYGATKDMTHNNMQPFFSSKTYGYNPVFEKERENMSVRKVELYSGSDQNPQFKHKQEVPYLFAPSTNRVESVTGVPNFNDFFDSRYIPSDKRQNERPFQPMKVTPGLNLGYNETGNTGFQDLYRVLPKNVDQLRTVDNAKVSYTPPVINGLKWGQRGIIGDFVQKGPDRFYYNTPDSMLPQVGDHVAPAIYGKFIVDPTNRSLAPDNIHLNPAGEKVDKSTPEYLQGAFKSPFKKTLDPYAVTNVQRDTRGQIINQDTWDPKDTQRQSTNYGDKFAGNMIGNKSQTYLENFENSVPDATGRETLEQPDVINYNGNHTQVPLINFLNYIPQITKKQILLEDNGKNNITNVSNHIKGYLFNSINSIKDPTLRDLIADKIILTNTKGDHEQNYLFNASNAIQDPNMRNLSENNLILTNISNSEKGYLFNNLNAIPDPTFREIVNTLFQRGGLGYKGNHEETYMYNYMNAIPQTTLRELTENLIEMTNVTGPSGQVKQYLFNYINSIPDETLKQLTENKIVLTSLKPIQMKDYLIDYVNAIPDETLKEMTENQKYVIGQKGNHERDYAFNYDNGIPNTTIREISENQKYVIGQKGSKSQMVGFNYDNATPNTTLRDLSENQKNIIGTIGNKSQMIGFNYEDIPELTMRTMSENTKNITGMKDAYTYKDYMFNYQNGTPDDTNRNQLGATKNIVGTRGDGDQSRSRLDYNNALLNTVKEGIAKGRDPVPVKDNQGPTTQFTQYVFCNDKPSQQPIYGGLRHINNLPNELYQFS